MKLFIVFAGVDWTRHSSLSIDRLPAQAQNTEKQTKHDSRNQRIKPSQNMPIKQACNIKSNIEVMWWVHGQRSTTENTI